MDIQLIIGSFFFLLGLFFGVLSLRERQKNGPAFSIAGRTWLRIAVIFCVVGLCLAGCSIARGK